MSYRICVRHLASASLIGQQGHTLTLAGYPAPGNNTASSVGSTLQAGGRTITYGGFNPASYDDLFYVVGDFPGGVFSPTGPVFYGDGTLDALSFSFADSNLAGGIAVFKGTTSVSLQSGVTPLNTRFTLQVTSLADVALALTPAASISGMPAGVGAALNVPDLGFKANWFFELQNPQTALWGAAGPVFDGLPKSGPGVTFINSVGGAFYYTEPAPVPLPAAAWLLLSGLGSVAALARRRRAGQAT